MWALAGYRMMEERRSVLITGASRGFGRALLDYYNFSGWSVVPLGDVGIAERLGTELPNCKPIVGDVTHDNVGAAVRGVLREVSHIDILINNAGIPGQAVQIGSVTPLEVNALIQTHCLGALRCTKAALPFMQDGKRIIINVTSRFGSVIRQASGEYAGQSISYSYRIAKASLNMLSVCLAQELGTQGFVVCAVHPGRLRTDSGSSDANTEPAEAAKHFAKWVDKIDSSMNGKCFDLENETLMKW